MLNGFTSMASDASTRLCGVRRGAVALLAACTVLATAPAFAADWANVVMYHRFGEDVHPSTNIHLDQFDAHLEELQTGDYSVLPLPEIVDALRHGLKLPDRTVAITIDDAFLSVYTEAWPRLKKAGFPFTLFIATDAIDRGSPAYMNWDQIRQLANAGVTIGSQTASHPHMPTLSPERNRAELEKSNARFKTELGRVPTLFAYPYGEYGNGVRKAVADAGFVAAFGQHSGVSYAGADMFSLPRFAMNENYGDIARFRLAANALPLRVAEVTPNDVFLKDHNPPAFGFTVAEDLPNLGALNCFASNQPEAARLERLGPNRVEVRLDAPFEPGRGRINCTMPGPDRRWRWFGTQFYIPRG